MPSYQLRIPLSSDNANASACTLIMLEKSNRYASFWKFEEYNALGVKEAGRPGVYAPSFSGILAGCVILVHANLTGTPLGLAATAIA